MKSKMNKIGWKMLEKEHRSGSLTNPLVHKDDSRQMTADHSTVGVGPMARSKPLSAVKGLVDSKMEVDNFINFRW